MPPLTPPRNRRPGRGSGTRRRPREQRRLPSGRRRSTGGAAEQQRHLLRQRPRTQPDLLAGVREQGLRRGGADAAVPWASGRKAAPSKVLVTVAVQRSMWPLHVMARTEWRVADLVAAAVELYVKEGRRPLLPSADRSAFSLHYSQFSLQRLDPEEKLVELGSRSFFLCSKSAPVDASSACSPAEADKATVSPAKRPNACANALLAAAVIVSDSVVEIDPTQKL